MYSYIVRRLAFGVVAVVGVSIVVFVVLRILPGDPLVAIFGAEGFTRISEAERARYMADLGLSDPLPVQYLHWVQDILRGHLGHSFFRHESVAEMVLRRGPLTAEIALISLVLSWIVGIPVAVLSALRPNSVADNLTRFVSILFLAVPGFWLVLDAVVGQAIDDEARLLTRQDLFCRESFFTQRFFHSFASQDCRGSRVPFDYNRLGRPLATPFVDEVL
jgi:peptide/nickel transport system permease protein